MLGLALSGGTLVEERKRLLLLLGGTVYTSSHNIRSTVAQAPRPWRVVPRSRRRRRHRPKRRIHTAIAIIEATGCIRASTSRMRGAASPSLPDFQSFFLPSSPTPLVDVRACSLTNLSDTSCLLKTRRIAFRLLYVAYLPSAILTPCSHLKPTAHATRSTTL
jgi:hypothetical protein